MTITLAALITRFLDRPGLTNSTIRSNDCIFILLLQLYGGLCIEIVERKILVAYLLVAYLNVLKQVKFTTHHKHQAVITALFNFAIEQGYIRANPISQLKRPKPDWEKGEHNSD